VKKIVGSVGRGGKNTRNDVILVQSLLNDFMQPPARLLAEDGIVGPKTAAAIVDFQKRVVKYRNPDGRVDPGRQTIRALNGMGPGVRMPRTPATKVRKPAATGDKEREKLRKVFAEKGKESWWPEFWSLAVKDVTPEVDKFFKLIGMAEKGRQVVEFYILLRQAGIDTKEIKQIFQVIAGIEPRYGKEMVEWFASPSGPSGNFLRKLDKYGKAAGFVIFLIQYVNHWSKGDYHMALVEVYKTGMGEAVGWASLIDAVQSFVFIVIPKSWEGEKAYKCIKAINPIDLGAQAVDTAGVFITMAIEQKLDEKRLYRLVKRMEGGSTAIFVDIGNDLGDALYQISQMSDAEFDEAFTLNNFWGWMKSWVS
jgi:hypothetical protein